MKNNFNSNKVIKPNKKLFLDPIESLIITLQKEIIQLAESMECFIEVTDFVFYGFDSNNTNDLRTLKTLLTADLSQMNINQLRSNPILLHRFAISQFYKKQPNQSTLIENCFYPIILSSINSNNRNLVGLVIHHLIKKRNSLPISLRRLVQFQVTKKFNNQFFIFQMKGYYKEARFFEMKAKRTLSQKLVGELMLNTIITPAYLNSQLIANKSNFPPGLLNKAYDRIQAIVQFIIQIPERYTKSMLNTLKMNYSSLLTAVTSQSHITRINARLPWEIILKFPNLLQFIFSPMMSHFLNRLHKNSLLKKTEKQDMKNIFTNGSGFTNLQAFCLLSLFPHEISIKFLSDYFQKNNLNKKIIDLVAENTINLMHLSEKQFTKLIPYNFHKKIFLLKAATTWLQDPALELDLTLEKLIFDSNSILEHRYFKQCDFLDFILSAFSPSEFYLFISSQITKMKIAFFITIDINITKDIFYQAKNIVAQNNKTPFANALIMAIFKDPLFKVIYRHNLTEEIEKTCYQIQAKQLCVAASTPTNKAKYVTALDYLFTLFTYPFMDKLPKFFNNSTPLEIAQNIDTIDAINNYIPDLSIENVSKFQIINQCSLETIKKLLVADNDILNTLLSQIKQIRTLAWIINSSKDENDFIDILKGLIGSNILSYLNTIYLTDTHLAELIKIPFTMIKDDFLQPPHYSFDKILSIKNPILFKLILADYLACKLSYKPLKTFEYMASHAFQFLNCAPDQSLTFLNSPDSEDSILNIIDIYPNFFEKINYLENIFIPFSKLPNKANNLLEVIIIYPVCGKLLFALNLKDIKKLQKIKPFSLAGLSLLQLICQSFRNNNDYYISLINKNFFNTFQIDNILEHTYSFFKLSPQKRDTGDDMRHYASKYIPINLFRPLPDGDDKIDLNCQGDISHYSYEP